MKRHFRLKVARVGFSVLLAATLAWPHLRVLAQEIAKPSEVSLLPPRTGEALTVTPDDMPDLDCSIQKWNAAVPKPTLTLLCPPQDVFAPLHLYLKLSWLTAEEMPSYAANIVAPGNTLTKIRMKKTIALLRLRVTEKQGEPARPRWVPFTGVVDVGLLALRRRN